MNLLKIRRGALVQFAGKRWKVIKYSSDSIILEPSQGRGSVIHFTYPGGGIGFDAFLTNLMWQLLHSDEFPVRLVENNLRDRISYARDRIRKVCNVNDVPYTQMLEGIRYYTFAGYLINKAVALITEQPEYKADDISLLVP
ncbi:MAG TPA: hypothetical protein DCK76_02775 [Desulfotomaculum sp.]|nr:hypothetical protein [Desulfotomaculum sp.]HBY05309.1 hypothetical protein [Desulfotomaculum sp.]